MTRTEKIKKKDLIVHINPIDILDLEQVIDTTGYGSRTSIPNQLGNYRSSIYGMRIAKNSVNADQA
ncbi:MAG: hypothetical protein V7739_19830 [Motiliproteus sp.]